MRTFQTVLLHLWVINKISEILSKIKVANDFVYVLSFESANVNGLIYEARSLQEMRPIVVLRVIILLMVKA